MNFQRIFIIAIFLIGVVAAGDYLSNKGGEYGAYKGGEYGSNKGEYGAYKGGEYGANEGGQYGAYKGGEYGSNKGGEYGSNKGGEYGFSKGGQYEDKKSDYKAKVDANKASWKKSIDKEKENLKTKAEETIDYALTGIGYHIPVLKPLLELKYGKDYELKKKYQKYVQYPMTEDEKVAHVEKLMDISNKVTFAPLDSNGHPLRGPYRRKFDLASNVALLQPSGLKPTIMDGGLYKRVGVAEDGMIVYSRDIFRADCPGGKCYFILTSTGEHFLEAIDQSPYEMQDKPQFHDFARRVLPPPLKPGEEPGYPSPDSNTPEEEHLLNDQIDLRSE